ncbi:hypothetical protein J4P41_15435 [Gluconobacter sp. NFX36]|uniref:hypothetical protein n=1 Tax=Gluconobacter sp. NFX36 TaxID=2819535 RepID=UPI003CEE540C
MNSDKLIVFDSVEAARDPAVRIALLETAKADGSAEGMAHALRVIAEAKKLGDKQS